MTYRKIEITELLPADVIVTTDHWSPISSTIRNLTGSSISHTMVYAGNQEVIEARQEGVKRNPFNFATQTATLAIALRKPGISNEQRSKVVEEAQKFVDKKSYDYIGAAGSGYLFRYGFIVSLTTLPLFPKVQSVAKLVTGFTEKQIDDNASDEHADDAFFCSELVSRVFTLAGVPIVNGRATDQTPRQIRYSPYLQYLGHLIDIKEKPREENHDIHGYRHG